MKTNNMILQIIIILIGTGVGSYLGLDINSILYGGLVSIVGVVATDFKDVL